MRSKQARDSFQACIEAFEPILGFANAARNIEVCKAQVALVEEELEDAPGHEEASPDAHHRHQPGRAPSHRASAIRQACARAANVEALGLAAASLVILFGLCLATWARLGAATTDAPTAPCICAR